MTPAKARGRWQHAPQCRASQSHPPARTATSARTCSARSSSRGPAPPFDPTGRRGSCRRASRSCSCVRRAGRRSPRPSSSTARPALPMRLHGRKRPRTAHADRRPPPLPGGRRAAAPRGAGCRSRLRLLLALQHCDRRLRRPAGRPSPSAGARGPGPQVASARCLRRQPVRVRRAGAGRLPSRSLSPSSRLARSWHSSCSPAATPCAPFGPAERRPSHPIGGEGPRVSAVGAADGCRWLCFADATTRSLRPDSRGQLEPGHVREPAHHRLLAQRRRLLLR